MIELPADYIPKRVVPFESGTHSPDSAIVHHDPQAAVILLIVRMSSHQVLTRLLKRDLAPTLEEVWEMGKHSWGPREQDPKRRTQAEIDLLTHPLRYALAADVALYQQESGEVRSGEEGAGGWRVTPRWPRGHWRLHPCGPRRSERRRIAIPSVLGNTPLLRSVLTA